MTRKKRPEVLNEPLIAAMGHANFTRHRLAKEPTVDVLPKTIWHWTHRGVTPYMHHQTAVATLLGVGRTVLWPPTPSESAAARAAELEGGYENRSEVPPELWSEPIRRAQQRINVHAYAGLHFFESRPQLLDELKARADEGVEVRLLLGDPDSAAVAVRGQEEGIDMAARVRNNLKVIEPIVGFPGIEIRLVSTTLHYSLYNFDDTMIVNLHQSGVPASRAPYLHLRRMREVGIFNSYLRNFETLWTAGRPYCGRTLEPSR